jgi:hypothetical protein
MLRDLGAQLRKVGVAHSIVSNDDDWRSFCQHIPASETRLACTTHPCVQLRHCPKWIRIPIMAAIRNMALLPLLNATSVLEAAAKIPLPTSARAHASGGGGGGGAATAGGKRAPATAAGSSAAAGGWEVRTASSYGSERARSAAPSTVYAGVGAGAGTDAFRTPPHRWEVEDEVAHLPLPRPVRVLFLNDVLLYAEDMVELVLTEDGRYDMACAMDFEQLKFYDTWVARDMAGNSFSDWYPYVREHTAQRLMRQGKPFRVFSCWNGAVVVPASVITQHGVLFRSWHVNERRSAHPDASAAEVSRACARAHTAWVGGGCGWGGEMAVAA